MRKHKVVEQEGLPALTHHQKTHIQSLCCNYSVQLQKLSLTQFSIMYQPVENNKTASKLPPLTFITCSKMKLLLLVLCIILPGCKKVLTAASVAASCHKFKQSADDGSPISNFPCCVIASL